MISTIPNTNNFQKDLTYRLNPNRYYNSGSDGLVWLYGISTIIGYLVPNPILTYILNI